MVDFAFDLKNNIHRSNVIGLKTEKDDRGVRLTKAARLIIQHLASAEAEPWTAIMLEDVGTTGFSSGSVALECRQLGIDDVEVQNSLQRSTSLDFLDDNDIPHFSLFKMILPTLSPELCRAAGDCSKGVELIPYGQE
jgi:hypothetical protein